MRDVFNKTVWGVFAAAIAFNFVVFEKAEAKDPWGALVSCCFKTPCQNVSTGFGSGPSEQVAATRATASAMIATKGSDWKCTTVRTFSSGCGVIIGGFGKSNSAGFATGATPQEADASLSSQGLTADAIGGQWGCVGQ